MTDAEWDACDRPGPMLEAARGYVGDRQLRLFAFACCQSIWRFIPVGPCRDAVETSSRFADGRATAGELAIARVAAMAAAEAAGPHTAAAWAACESANPSAFLAARIAATEARDQLRRQSPRAADEEARAQAGFLRDIVGNPFLNARTPPLLRVARHPHIQEIAQEFDGGGPGEDMTALADALEQLGYPDDAVLEHCRSPGPHVRGCWVVDLILRTPVVPPSAEPPTVPPSVGPVVRSVTVRVQEAREALARQLRPKTYRRAVRKALAAIERTGSVGRLDVWDGFIQRHPEYDLSDAELVGLFTFCYLHSRPLVECVVRGDVDRLLQSRDQQFLEARARQFPFAHDEQTDGEWERRIWWCSECQLARQAWLAGQGLGS